LNVLQEEGYNIPGSKGKGPTAAQKKKMEAAKAKAVSNATGCLSDIKALNASNTLL